ncbi:LacI family DNA-binding transcriptional regulator [Sphingobacteriaceae bacterium WQ 2009]|uniref:LacI family DNA-binding transcriptional regulator n=1 Tax=Rhinopithecimicrobium faecis TaxID=2820698 RepID=A0A8T4HAP2_9SPHI|nr:LacI family DNA-binding transcriptional regulator [Sphingobacteriaceae bacterium WQ 2009]
MADTLGLATSTVSKALSDSYEISVETKERVRKLALEFNYKPNILAKSLKTGRSNTIAVIIPYLSNPFQSQLLEGAQQAAIEGNFKIIFMQSRENPQLEEECLEMLFQQNIDGVIISPCANSNIESLKRYHQFFPLVLVDRIDFDLPMFKIGVNNEKGAYEATQHLIDSGRKDILVICAENIGVSQQRLLGYKKALIANFIPYCKDAIVQINYQQSQIDLKRNLTQLLAEKLKEFDRPIGVLCTTDTITLYVLGILANLDISVPKDVAVIGFANTEYAESLNPALTTIVQPACAIGNLGVKKLIGLIQAKDRFEMAAQTTLLETYIVPRKSTSKIRHL